MSLSPRVIPVLLIDQGRLVKTAGFADPSYIGDPINTVRIFNNMEVDELIVIDISASRSSRAPDTELLGKLAAEAFMPLTYGGGIQNREQISELLSLGYEKVAIETLAIQNPGTVQSASDWFGAQAIVGVITTTGSGPTTRPRWAQDNSTLRQRIDVLQQVNVGEVLHYDSDRDGMRTGYNLSALSEFAGLISTPLIALGGAGKIKDLVDAVGAGADAVAAGSMFCQHGSRLAPLISYPPREAIVAAFLKPQPSKEG